MWPILIVSASCVRPSAGRGSPVNQGWHAAGAPGSAWDDLSDTAQAQAAHTHTCPHCGTRLTHSGPREGCMTDWRCA